LDCRVLFVCATAVFVTGPLSVVIISKVRWCQEPREYKTKRAKSQGDHRPSAKCAPHTQLSHTAAIYVAIFPTNPVTRTARCLCFLVRSHFLSCVAGKISRASARTPPPLASRAPACTHKTNGQHTAAKWPNPALPLLAAGFSWRSVSAPHDGMRRRRRESHGLRGPLRSGRVAGS
jgi:hypothetical protein